MGSTELWRRDVDRDGRIWAEVAFDVDGWTATFASDYASPYFGAERLTVTAPKGPGPAGAAIESDGLTLDVLRVLPLREARTVIRSMKAKKRQAQTPIRPLPKRLDGDADWTDFALAYRDAYAIDYRHPLKVLQERHDLSRGTVTTRVRLARENGYLAGPEGKPPNDLGPKAKAALKRREG